MIKKIFLIISICFFFLFSFTIISAETTFSKENVRYDADAIDIMSNVSLSKKVLNESGFPSLEIYDNEVWINEIIRKEKIIQN